MFVQLNNLRQFRNRILSNSKFRVKIIIIKTINMRYGFSALPKNYFPKMQLPVSYCCYVLCPMSGARMMTMVIGFALDQNTLFHKFNESSNDKMWTIIQLVSGRHCSMFPVIVVVVFAAVAAVIKFFLLPFFFG